MEGPKEGVQYARPPRQSTRVSIRTNLLELVSVIGEVVGDDKEGLVAQTVLHLMETGRLRFLGQGDKGAVFY